MAWLVRDKNFYKKLMILTVPIALQNIITFAVGLSDNIMVGSLGEVALSGVFVANQMQNILQMLVIGFGAAMMVLANQYWGRGDVQSVKTLIAISMRIACCVGIALWLAVLLWPEAVVSLFTNDAATLASAVEYAKIICFSYLFFCMTNVLIIAMRCVETAKLGTFSALTAFFVNVFLNWVFIFGKLGAPAMGVPGAALATLIARIVEFAVVAVYVMRVDTKLRLKLNDLLLRNGKMLRDYLKYGLPVLTGDLLWGVNLSVQGAIVGRLGPAVIASVSISNIVFQIVSVGIYGLANAAGVVVGQTVGAGDYDKVKAYARTLQVIFVTLGVAAAVVLFTAKDYILLLYNISGETVTVAKQLMTVLSVTIIGTAYQMPTLTGIVRAGGATHFVLVNDLIFVWGLVLPSATIAAFVLGAPAWIVFACLKSDQVLKCAVAAVKVNRFRWMKNLTGAC
ncbi:MATE family efflux transporter [Clostridia bacterium]|nr:MATE family efflux transporter [Clostridia bacterium]